MLTLNGKRFAKNDAEFVGSLFQSGSTCLGYYRQRKGGILLMDMQKNPRAFIVNRSSAEQFIVTAHSFQGKTRYMNGLSCADEEWLGMPQFTFAAERSVVRNAIESLST